MNSVFARNGVAYHPVEIISHPTADLTLVRVAESLPGWYRYGASAGLGTRVLIGGDGRTRGNFVGNGWDWTGLRGITWGANVIESLSGGLRMRFDEAGSPGWVEGEMGMAIYDSGSGVFVETPSGELILAGIGVSTTSWNVTPYGSWSVAVSVANYLAWIQTHVAPGAPVASSQGIPLIFGNLPIATPAPGALGLLGAAGLFCAARRRRAA